MQLLILEPTEAADVPRLRAGAENRLGGSMRHRPGHLSPWFPSDNTLISENSAKSSAAKSSAAVGYQPTFSFTHFE